jgi:hypothetical protein
MGLQTRVGLQARELHEFEQRNLEGSIPADAHYARRYAERAPEVQRVSAHHANLDAGGLEHRRDQVHAAVGEREPPLGDRVDRVRTQRDEHVILSEAHQRVIQFAVLAQWRHAGSRTPDWPAASKEDRTGERGRLGTRRAEQDSALRQWQR